MKKLIQLVVCILFSLAGVSAQIFDGTSSIDREYISANQPSEISTDLNQPDSSAEKWSLEFNLGGTYLFPDFFTYAEGNKLKLGYSTQITLNYFMPESFLLNAGFMYNTLRTESVFEGPLSSGADSKTFYSNYRFFQLPVGVAYRFKIKRCYAQFGLENSFGFLIDNKQMTYDDVEGSVENEDLFEKCSFVDFINVDFKCGFSFRKFDFGIDNRYSKQIRPLIYYTTGTSGMKYANNVLLSYLSSFLYFGFRF